MSRLTPVEELPNLGPASAGWLREAGVGTVPDLRRLGPVAAYRLVKARRPQTSLNLLPGRWWPARGVGLAPLGHPYPAGPEPGLRYGCCRRTWTSRPGW